MVMKATSETYTYHETQNQTVHGTVYPIWSGTFSHTYNKRWCIGEVTHNYKKKVRNGEFLPYTYWKQGEVEHNFIPSTWSFRDANQPGIVWNSNVILPYNSWILTDIAHAADTSYVMAELQRAANSIAGKGFDGLTSVLEAKKLPDLFRQTGRTLQKVYDNTRKLNRGEILDAWTSGRYGYRTLAYDLANLHDAVLEFDNQRKIWTERSGYSITQASTIVDRLSGASQDVVNTREYRTEHSLRGSVCAEFRPTRFVFDPIKTAWELQRYSFILDWAISIGDALGAAKLMFSAANVTSCRGLKSTTTLDSNSVSEYKPGWSGSGGYHYNATITVVERLPMSLSLKPSLRGRHLSPDQFTDLVSIFDRERRRIR